MIPVDFRLLTGTELNLEGAIQNLLKKRAGWQLHGMTLMSDTIPRQFAQALVQYEQEPTKVTKPRTVTL